MTYQERYNELYDELQRLTANLHSTFLMGQTFEEQGGNSRPIDPDILILKIGALRDAAQELKFLMKFNGSLHLVKK